MDIVDDAMFVSPLARTVLNYNRLSPAFVSSRPVESIMLLDLKVGPR